MIDLARASHFELVYPFGRREIVDAATYRALPLAAIASAIARPISRREAIRRIARRRAT